MEIARSIVVERQRALETMEKSVETYAGGPHASPVRVVASRLVAGDKREELRALESAVAALGEAITNDGDVNAAVKALQRLL